MGPPEAAHVDSREHCRRCFAWSSPAGSVTCRRAVPAESCACSLSFLPGADDKGSEYPRRVVLRRCQAVISRARRGRRSRWRPSQEPEARGRHSSGAIRATPGSGLGLAPWLHDQAGWHRGGAGLLEDEGVLVRAPDVGAPDLVVRARIARVAHRPLESSASAFCEGRRDWRPTSTARMPDIGYHAASSCTSRGRSARVMRTQPLTDTRPDPRSWMWISRSTLWARGDGMLAAPGGALLQAALTGRNSLPAKAGDGRGARGACACRH